MCKVFFSARIINHDTGHNKFISENIIVSNEKKLDTLKFNQKNCNRFHFLITAVCFFLFLSSFADLLSLCKIFDCFLISTIDETTVRANKKLLK